jgi:hypothetical protein
MGSAGPYPLKAAPALAAGLGRTAFEPAPRRQGAIAYRVASTRIGPNKSNEADGRQWCEAYFRVKAGAASEANDSLHAWCPGRTLVFTKQGFLYSV